ncbi:MAG: hypothetical protein HFJ50_06355 [Clostridia bacterium]|jgi:hypothetical protein|nr:hypothetical protein [Clostridia bacterium]
MSKKPTIIIGIIITACIIALITIFILNIFMKDKKVEEEIEISENSEYFINKLKEIPEEFPVESAVNKGYFVYDAVGNKVYGKEILDNFVSNAKNGIRDEIIIVIYNVNGNPSIYGVGYGFNNGKDYILAKDCTRIDVFKTEMMSETQDGIIEAPKEYYDIVVNEDIPSEYFEINVTEDTGIDAGIISLKLYNTPTGNKNYKNIEIARYMLNNFN